MSTSDDVQLRCTCGAGYCKVLVSGTSKNPYRMYIKCPNAVGTGRGCGLWQWLDEVRMCPCNAGICKCLKSNSATNTGKWFYCCPKSTAGSNNGCGHFSWKDSKNKETVHEKVVGEKKECEDKKKMEELRKFLEMKKSITNEVCESVLEQLKKLSFD